jgi:nickel/cobalt transporter (NicO) family protein
MDTLVAIQQVIQESIASMLRDFDAQRSWLTLLGVLPVGILFGAVHALTPGHGKAALSSYLLASEGRISRGTITAIILALTHVGSAVVISLVASFLVSRALGQAGRAPALEAISRSLLVILGLWLIYRALRRTHVHGSPTGSLSLGIAAGLIPCPLTMFVMAFALSRGIVEAGLTFAVAMMVGIALTLTAVAVLSVLARNTMLSMFERYPNAAARAESYVNLIGGLLLTGIGLSQLPR